MRPDVVLIPAKGVADGKSRLRNVLSPSRRQELNLAQLRQTLHAAAAVFGSGNTYVVSACAGVEEVAAAAGLCFIREGGVPPGLNEALEQARAHVVHSVSPRSMAILPVDLPGVGEAALREVLASCPVEEALIVPDRAGQGTNFLRIPASCGIPFAYGEGSFARHVRLLAQEDVNVRVVGQTCLRDDLDEPLQLRLYGRYGDLLAA
ncbi:2-phospho-L-lactate guanylyltransferase [Ramlibacter sp.]|uniref:2-phospho-L-lactate guanylyltransferase n=1 Tax=Ramlibacter sp. TaxID=1917967 RepID=UPI002FCA7730